MMLVTSSVSVGKKSYAKLKDCRGRETQHFLLQQKTLVGFNIQRVLRVELNSTQTGVMENNVTMNNGMNNPWVLGFLTAVFFCVICSYCIISF